MQPRRLPGWDVQLAGHPATVRRLAREVVNGSAAYGGLVATRRAAGARQWRRTSSTSHLEGTAGGATSG